MSLMVRRKPRRPRTWPTNISQPRARGCAWLRVYQDWFCAVPPITRTYVTGAIAVTAVSAPTLPHACASSISRTHMQGLLTLFGAAHCPLACIIYHCHGPPTIRCTQLCSLDLISPFSLYFNLHMVVAHWQLWRLVTNFFFFGALGIDFLFHMFFLARCALHRSCLVPALATCHHHITTAGRLSPTGGGFLPRAHCRLWRHAYIWGAAHVCGLHRCVTTRLRTQRSAIATAVLASQCCSSRAVISAPPFMGSSLAFMMVYVWARRNEDVRNGLTACPFFLTIVGTCSPFARLPPSLACGTRPCSIIRLAGAHVLSGFVHLSCTFPPVGTARVFGLVGQLAHRRPDGCAALSAGLKLVTNSFSEDKGLALAWPCGLALRLGPAHPTIPVTTSRACIRLWSRVAGIGVGHLYFFLDDVYRMSALDPTWLSLS